CDQGALWRTSQTERPLRRPAPRPRSHDLSTAHYVVSVPGGGVRGEPPLSTPAAPRPLPCPRRTSAMAKAGKAAMAADEGNCVQCKAKRQNREERQYRIPAGRRAHSIDVVL